MKRPILAIDNIHTSIQKFVATNRQQLVTEVQAAIAAHSVVVVGMGQNPMVKKARKLLDAAGTTHHDLSYGNYFSMWRERNALKMWTGWPTFPMVFVRGTLVGGCSDVERLIDSGELKTMLAN